MANRRMLEQDIENMLSNLNTIGDFISSSSVSEPGHLEELAEILSEKAVDEPLRDTTPPPYSAKRYAQLCSAITDMLPAIDDEALAVGGAPPASSKKETFTRCLVAKCQEEFQRSSEEAALSGSDRQDVAPCTRM
ncbi:hypothetical protein T484DRAFT_1817264 [Baffinella frigidus]|nr:hypothetical protein T484DRAFT_1817264 [Cryptophyta sp. CCMP2293]